MTAPFVRHPVSTVSCTLALTLLGLYGMIHAHLELAPRGRFPRIVVLATWPGAAATSVQQDMTSRIEELSATIDGVVRTESVTTPGGCTVTLDLDDSADVEMALIDVRERIGGLNMDLPIGAEPIRADLQEPKEFESRPFLSVCVAGTPDMVELRSLVTTRLAAPIRSLPGISQVRITGGSDPVLRVTADETRLRAYDIALSDLKESISRSRPDIAVAHVETTGSEAGLRVPGEFRDLRQVEDIPLGESNGLRLGDVAKVEICYEPPVSFRRLNGVPVVGLDIVKAPGTPPFGLRRAVRRALEENLERLPAGSRLLIVTDEAGELANGIRALAVTSAAIGAVLLILVWILIGSLLPAVFTLVSVTASAAITLGLVQVLGITCDLLTLSGLALSLGMLVDNAVVAFDSIWDRCEKDPQNLGGIVDRLNAVAGTTLTSTLILCTAFAAFPFFQGRFRTYYVPLAQSVTIALITSWVLSITFIPAVSTWIKRAVPQPSPRPLRIYQSLLRTLLRHPFIVMTAFAAITIWSLLLFHQRIYVGGFFRWRHDDRLSVEIYGRQGTPPGLCDQVMREFERVALDQPFAKRVDVHVNPRSALASIEFSQDEATTWRVRSLKRSLVGVATEFTGISMLVSGVDSDDYLATVNESAPSLWIRFSGYNYEVLSGITENTKRLLELNWRVRDVEIVPSLLSGRASDVDLTVGVGGTVASEATLTPRRIATALQERLQTPLTQAEIQIDGVRYPLVIGVPARARQDLAIVEQVPLRLKGGISVALHDTGAIHRSTSVAAIRRVNREFQQVIRWKWFGPGKAAEQFRKGVYQGLRLPPGYSAEIKEQFGLTVEERSKALTAALIGCCFIFMMLCFVYESVREPLIILSVIPIAAGGVALAFVLADWNFNASAMVGLMLLQGMIVSNANIMTKHIQRRRQSTAGPLEAVCQGATDGCRPVLLTSLTTILGMIPFLTTGLRSEADVWSALALASVGGLFASTLGVLVALPVVYSATSRHAP